MEEVSNNIESSLLLRFTGYLEQNVGDQHHSFEELRDALIQQANFYKEENVKMEGVIKKLQCLRSEFNQETQTELDKLVTLQEHFEAKVCNTESIHLSQAERLRKQNNYVIKIKSCIKIYHNLIEKLSKDIKIAKGELERSEKKICMITSVSDDEVKMLQMKIERYEKELLKFEKRYPWLSDSQYNLQNISKETETLNNLRKAKEKLIQELDVYHGLKPDVCEAAQQLENLKKEYDSMK